MGEAKRRSEKYARVIDDVLRELTRLGKQGQFEFEPGEGRHCLESVENRIRAVMKSPDADGTPLPGGTSVWSQRAELVEAAAFLIAEVAARDAEKAASA